MCFQNYPFLTTIADSIIVTEVWEVNLMCVVGSTYNDKGRGVFVWVKQKKVVVCWVGRLVVIVEAMGIQVEGGRGVRGER